MHTLQVVILGTLINYSPSWRCLKYYLIALWAGKWSCVNYGRETMGETRVGRGSRVAVRGGAGCRGASAEMRREIARCGRAAYRDHQR